MIFNSLEFLIFITIFFAFWPFLRNDKNLKWFFITFMSFIFYGWWDWRFLFLIIGSGLLDFWCGLKMTQSIKNKKFFLLLSIFGNVAGLSVFKYGFFIGTLLEDIFLLLGSNINLVSKIPDFTLIVPVGISFYTFQSMSYSIDIYNDKLKPTKNLLHFFSFLSMFPQLVAGPIIRAKDLLIQLDSNRKPKNIEIWNGLKLIVFGLFQKMVIADNIAVFVDAAYDGKTHFDGTIYWWFVIIGFGFQIYNDFCGYSLIARGIAKCMGLHFRINFNHPYISESLREFWTRWHISLSTWFRDYLYIPLGGNKKGLTLGVLFMVITMVISGIWHGANYTFIFWGLFHGIFLAIERLTKWNYYLSRFSFGRCINLLITFLTVMLSWNLFRSSDITQSLNIFNKLLIFKSTDFSFISQNFNPLFFLSIGLIIELLAFIRKKTKFLFLSFYSQYWIKESFILAIAIVFIFLFHGQGKTFIYFQF